MKFDEKITIEMDENLVKAMLCEQLKLNGYECSVDDIVIDVGREYRGIGPMEHEVVFFRGCRAKNIKVNRALSSEG